MEKPLCYFLEKIVDNVVSHAPHNLSTKNNAIRKTLQKFPKNKQLLSDDRSNQHLNLQEFSASKIETSLLAKNKIQ